MRPIKKQVLVPLALCGAITAVTAAGMGSVAGGAGGASATNPAFLPIGDGKVTTAGAKRDYVYSCQSGTRPGGGPPGGAGAFVDGPWIRDDGTYDLTAKATVDGSVRWRNAKLRKTRNSSRRVFAGNGLPRGNSTGNFPIQPGDDAYSYDRNPNSIRSQSVYYSLPRRPKRASQPTCLSMGPIGIARNGVAIFNALDALDRDAVAHEVQDRCGGHPQQQGLYHYHAIPSCLTKKDSAKRHSSLVGFALDGFPIYGPRGAGGKQLSNTNLDACHGHTHKVRLDGRVKRIYHYHATLEYPYTLGCYRGTPRTS